MTAILFVSFLGIDSRNVRDFQPYAANVWHLHAVLPLFQTLAYLHSIFSIEHWCWRSCVYHVYASITVYSLTPASMASPRSSSPSLQALNLRPSSLLKTLTILGILIVIFSYSYWNRLVVLPANFIHRKPLPSNDFQFDHPTGQNWTHRIWQTSKNPVAAIDDEERERVRTWSDLNPEYRHEVLTDEMMEDYVKDQFHSSHPDIEKIYFDVKDNIVRSDLIRYLILLADGGVYNDLDVGCEKPIKTWVPPQYQDSAGVVLGVEVDNKFGPDGRTFHDGQDLFQLVNWTIMSKPSQPFMWFLVTRVMHNIRRLAALRKQSMSKLTYTIQEVLDVSGPAALTRAFFDYASNITDSNVTYHNFTKMTQPRLIGEVVILPIQAFGAGHQVQWAGWEPDGSELIHHYFAGSWKTDHDDSVSQPPLVEEEQKQEQDTSKAKAEKQKQAEEEAKKKAEAEKKKQAEEEAKKKAEEEKKKQLGGDGKAEADQDSKNLKDNGKSGGSASPQNSTQGAKEETSHVKGAQTSPETSVTTDTKPPEGKAPGNDSDKTPASDKPGSVQHVEDSTSEKPAENESMMDKIEKAKADKEAKAKAEAEKQKVEKVKEKEAAEAKAKATKEEEAAKKKLAEEEAEAEKKVQEEKKAEEERLSNMTQEEKEEEERKQKWEEVKAAAPKEARPKSAEEKQKASNNLADYDYQPD